MIVILRKTRMALHLMSTCVSMLCLYQLHKTYISVEVSSASTGFFSLANVLRLQEITALLQVLFITTVTEVSKTTASSPSTSVWRVLTSTIQLLVCLALLLVLAGIEINPGPPNTEEPETAAAALLAIMNKELEKLMHASDILQQFTKKGKISKGMKAVVKNAANKFNEINASHEVLVTKYSDWELVCGISEDRKRSSEPQIQAQCYGGIGH